MPIIFNTCHTLNQSGLESSGIRRTTKWKMEVEIRQRPRGRKCGVTIDMAGLPTRSTTSRPELIICNGTPTYRVRSIIDLMVTLVLRLLPEQAEELVPLRVEESIDLGRATVLQFVKDGCERFVITDIVETTLIETAKLAKEVNQDVKVEAVAGNLNSEAFVESLISKAKMRFGRLDYAVNNAGISGKPGPTHEMEFLDHKRVQEVNVDGLWLCERAELKAMIAQDLVEGYSELSYPLIDSTRGSIVNTASICGVVALSMCSPYVASKHAVIGITKSDAIHYAKNGIRINAVLPG
jgi:NAD(P)-dependent dehydrogenase (short-subunit alcohol dehydrogenase family)